MIIQRRAFLVGMASVFAMPAVVKAAWIMPIKAPIQIPEFRFYSKLYEREFTVAEFAALTDERLDWPLLRA